jgi:dTDP-4-amino-4,6-dideoxygalactose transaminase
VVIPVEQPYARAVYHLYVIRHPPADALAAALKERGIGTLVHYPIPLHLQPAFAELGNKRGDFRWRSARRAKSSPSPSSPR